MEVTFKAYQEIKVLVDMDSKVWRALKGIRQNIQSTLDEDFDFEEGKARQVELSEAVEYVLKEAARGW